MKWFAWGCFVLFAAVGVAQELDEGTVKKASSMSVLPVDWFGQWRGEVTQQSLSGLETRFQMELKIAPLSEPGQYSWTILYNGKQGQSERPYKLVYQGSPGRFQIDEQNGIKIETTLIGTSIASHFQIGGQTLWSSYSLRSINGVPEIQFELFSANSNSLAKTVGEDGAPEVTSLVTESRQIAVLRKANSENKNQQLAGNPIPNWRKLDTVPYRGKQDDLYFVNENLGWYVNGEGRIYKTSNGGKLWDQQLHQSGTFFRCIAFLDESHGFAGNIGPGYFPNVTDTHPLYETLDGGVSWKPVRSIEGPPVTGLCALQVLKEPFVNAGQLDFRVRLIGVGRVGGPAVMIVSDDLGKTWQRIEIAEQAAMAFDVYFFDRNVGFIAAASSAEVAQSHALILATEDGGKSWRKAWESSRPFELTWKISFPTRETGFVTIQSYNPDPLAADRFVAKTMDGGKNWTEIPLIRDAKVRQFGVAFLDEKTGWIGAVPHGFQTIDGGANWSAIDMGNAVNKIRLIPGEAGTVGYAIGTNVYRLDLPK